MDSRNAYEELLRLSREQTLLASCSSLLSWDEQTYMPAGGSEHRGRQMALLAGMHHQAATDPRIGELLGECEGSAPGDGPEAANLREIRRAYDRRTKMPRSLVEELARSTSIAQQEWAVSRRDRDFHRLRPWLETIVRLKRREAECVGFADSPYDALLDEYEPGATSRELTVLFESLRTELVPLVAAIGQSPRQPDPKLLRNDFPVDRQRAFVEEVARSLGFDFTRGRLDTSHHPFCSGIGPGDCRITTRFDPRDFSDSFFGVLHEVGHGLYDQGLIPESYGTPMGEAVSLGVHESQSRLWENAVGRSRAFWAHWFPRARQVFPEALARVDVDDFRAAINRVEPSLIRVKADEVTYNLHILIRFELERALVAGDMRVDELPGVWAEKHREYLGIVPENDAEGCLQDIHWSAGLFGYFPTYTLGNLYAAQLFDRAKETIGDLEGSFARGDFTVLLGWLRETIHRHGQHYPAADLIERATGSPPDSRALIRMLREKYGELYGI